MKQSDYLMLLSFIIIITFVCQSNSVEDLYDGCGITEGSNGKGCFGLPQNCVSDGKNCAFLVTFQKSPSEKNYDVQMMAKGLSPSGGYVALGFSDNNEMDSDGVIACFLAVLNPGKPNEVKSAKVREYYIEAKPNNTEAKLFERLEFHSEIFTASPINTVFQQYNGTTAITCQFSIHANVDWEPIKKDSYNLNQHRFFLLLAGGNSASDEELGKPYLRDVSSRPMLLSEKIIVNDGIISSATLPHSNLHYVGNSVSSANQCGWLVFTVSVFIIFY